jgi:hypothetical protein
MENNVASASASSGKATTKSRPSGSKRKRQTTPSSPVAVPSVFAPSSSSVDSMEQDDTTTITVTGNDGAVEIVTMHDDASSSPSPCKDTVEPKPKRSRTEKGKAKLIEENGVINAKKPPKSPSISCGTIHPGQSHVVLLDGSHRKIKSESSCNGSAGGGKPDVTRFYVCTDHDTYLGSFGSCTLVMAANPQDAQDALDMWLTSNMLLTRALFPYRLDEIVPRKRGVTLVNVPSQNVNIGHDVKSTLTGDLEMRFEDLGLFVYKDIEKCSPTLCGAVIFAVSAADALKLLTEELTAHSLLSHHTGITEQMIEQEITTLSGCRGKVIPLSVYMVDEANE